ncbi:HEAT repeat domain-containing protein [uncultured Thalassolituus sp.]|uniref:HEAT repeat domain-containing protein n=1 Tax=uncultured Thalassolituus sp. TaxID=285273 RepID=UPI00261B7184|nr:HEAT repeat domain-containing protein [uncultured Thalassolituus sp.]
MALKKSRKKNTTQSQNEKRDCNQIRNELLSDDASSRRWAARDIVNCPGATHMLLDQLNNEEEPSVRQVILSSLTQLGDSEAVEGLVNCLRSEDASLRNEAIEAMKQLPEEVAPIMATLLNDPDPDVRIFAVNILESLCHDDVEQWLVSVIRDDEHVNVCATAVDLLGEVGSEISIEALTGLKDRFTEEPYIQFAADLAMKRISGD